jgi:hypothetical protein
LYQFIFYLNQIPAEKTLMKHLITFIIVVYIGISNVHAQPNMVLCWIFSMQGCPGVEPVGGNAINSSNNGARGVGAIGGRTSRVETRTIINVPDYRIRRFLRSLGLGGQRINISYEHDESDCLQTSDSLRPSSNALFEPNSANECLRALQEDLNSLPQGINLQVLQCQDLFCNPDFTEIFEAFLENHPQFSITNSQTFLGCRPGIIEI